MGRIYDNTMGLRDRSPPPPTGTVRASAAAGRSGTSTSNNFAGATCSSAEATNDTAPITREGLEASTATTTQEQQETQQRNLQSFKGEEESEQDITNNIATKRSDNRASTSYSFVEIEQREPFVAMEKVIGHTHNTKATLGVGEEKPTTTKSDPFTATDALIDSEEFQPQALPEQESDSPQRIPREPGAYQVNASGRGQALQQPPQQIMDMLLTDASGCDLGQSTRRVMTPGGEYVDLHGGELLRATEILEHDEELAQATELPASASSSFNVGRLRRSSLEAEKKRQQCNGCYWQPRVMIPLLVLTLSLCALIAGTYAVITARHKENTTTVEVDTDDNKKMDDSTGSDAGEAPLMMTPEQRVLALLPSYTIASIQQNDDEESSPQRQAYQWIINDPMLEEYSDPRILQRYVLATIHYGLGGKEWYRSDNWLSYDHHECDWQTKADYKTYRDAVLFWGRSGVAEIQYGPCEGINGTAPQVMLSDSDQELPHQQNPGGIYQQLFIENNNLRGTIPEELYLMSQLQTLNLLKNSIGGTISPRMSQLSNLELLFLDSNDLTGTIPTEVGMLSSISSLWILGNPSLGGTIPTEIAQLSTLKELLIDSCNLSGSIPSTMGHLTQLEWFWAWSNPSLMGSLPTQLGLLSNMRQLGLWNCALTGTIPSQIGQMSSMAELAFDANPITGSIPSQVGLLSKLTTLHIGELSLSSHTSQSNSNTIPTELGLLTNLASMFLHSNGLSGALPTELGLLTRLWRLWIFNNSLTGTINPVLLEGWEASLEIMKMDTNKLTGLIPSQLGQMTALSWLGLSGNQLRGTLPSEMVELNALKEVQLATNSFSGTITHLLHENMTILSLHSNSFTGVVPSEIGLMTDLTLLSIHNNSLVGTIPVSLCDSDSWIEGIHVDCESVECRCEVCICQR